MVVVDQWAMSSAQSFTKTFCPLFSLSYLTCFQEQIGNVWEKIQWSQAGGCPLPPPSFITPALPHFASFILVICSKEERHRICSVLFDLSALIDFVKKEEVFKNCSTTRSNLWLQTKEWESKIFSYFSSRGEERKGKMLASRLGRVNLHA